MYRAPPGALARPVEVLDQPFIRSNDSLGRPPLYSPSLACRVVHINPAIIPNLPMCPLPLERVQVHIGFLPLLSSDKCRGFYSIGLRLETAICGRPAFSPASCSPRGTCYCSSPLLRRRFCGDYLLDNCADATILRPPAPVGPGQSFNKFFLKFGWPRR